MTEQKSRLKDAKPIGIMSLQMFERKLSATESLVIADLSQSKYCYKSMLDRICKEAGILQEYILLILEPPPCNTSAAAMNQERGYHNREYSQPHRSPRDDDNKYAKEAREHDGMTSKVGKAPSQGIEHMGTQADLEAPKGGTKRLMLMNEPR